MHTNRLCLSLFRFRVQLLIDHLALCQFDTLVKFVGGVLGELGASPCAWALPPSDRGVKFSPRPHMLLNRRPDLLLAHVQVAKI
jgi:hypothetical protein